MRWRAGWQAAEEEGGWWGGTRRPSLTLCESKQRVRKSCRSEGPPAGTEEGLLGAKVAS